MEYTKFKILLQARGESQPQEGNKSQIASMTARFPCAALFQPLGQRTDACRPGIAIPHWLLLRLRCTEARSHIPTLRSIEYRVNDM